MKQMPQFSILMANYDNGRYIEEAIDSVLAQTFKDWELVIIDDASQDNSVRRIEKYLNDPRIRLHAREKNEGYTKALIYGLTKVASEIVGILDSDDALLPDAVAKVQSVHSQRPELGLVLTQMTVCDAHLQPLFTTTNTPMHLSEPLLWMRGSTAFRSFKLATYNKTVGLDTRLSTGQDWDLVFKLEEVAPTYRLNEPLYRYRQRSSAANAASTKYKTHRNMARALYGAQLRRRGTTLPSLPRAALLAWMVAGVRYSLELAQPGQAFLFALRSLRIAPLNSASWRALGKSLRALVASLRMRQTNQAAPARTKRIKLKNYPPYVLQSHTGNIEPDRIVCIPLLHDQGHCAFGGDYLILEDGWYNAVFEMQLEAQLLTQDPLVILDVYENLQTRSVLAERQVTLADRAEASGSFQLEFPGKALQRVEFRVYWKAQCVLTLICISLEQILKNAPEEAFRAESVAAEPQNPRALKR